MRAAATYLTVSMLAVALFLLLPQIDPLTSRLFYSAGRGFFLKHWPPVTLIYRSVPWLAAAMIATIAVAGAWLYLAERPLWRFDRKALFFVALSLALGPGLIVNTVLKDHWGRARPLQIEAFGGNLTFTPAPLPTTECPRNCSFPSGHAALGFSLLAFAYLLPEGATRRRGVAATLSLGALIGIVRIAQGAHFLSDVVFAGLIVYGTTAALFWAVVRRDILAAPIMRRAYLAAGRTATMAWPVARRVVTQPMSRLRSATVLAALVVFVSVAMVDRPAAIVLHAESPEVRTLFERIGRLGLGWGWLAGFCFGFVALHWGGALPRLRRIDRRLRAFSPIPAFLFVAVAASGIAADILKVLCGRTRPKLLFSADLYGFTGFAWHADHWSFPSGHAATITALAAALWYLWPRHILFYVTIAAIVSASRVVSGAHYPGDAIAGAWLAVLTTRGVVMLFANAGVDLAAARSGRLAADGAAPRICRHFGRVVTARGPPSE
jgi:lipid A 4'-phosphatase